MTDDQAAYGKDEEGNKPKVVTPDASFINSDGHKLGDLKLYPYTPDRMFAADAMGLRYGRLSNAAARQFVAKGTYPGMEADVVIIVWLCSLENIEEVRSARRDPDLAEDVAIEFAKTHNMVSKLQDSWWDAYKVFKSIMAEVQEAYGKPKKKDVPETKAA
jgi:hypothetical protein